ncbi:MAG: hypothetical protein ABMA26_03110 [Limisphaerales bacterium]
MLALRLILLAIVAASAGVIVLGEMKLKPLLDELKEKEKKVTEDLGKEKQESTKQKDRAMKAELDAAALKDDLNRAKTAEDDAKKAADVERMKAVAAGQETNLAKQETAKAKQEAADYFALQSLGLTPPVIRRINAELPQKTNELNTLKREQQLINVQLVKKSGELNAFLNPKGAVALPPGLIGTVKAYDPKWEFVVLDIGANHGLLRNGELTISREGKLVARVKLDKVETDWATANVVKGFKLGEIKEGDAVLTPSSTVLPPQK